VKSSCLLSACRRTSWLWRCGLPATRITDIVNEKRGLTAATALRLSRYFGTTSRFWMNMQASWELEVAEDQLGNAVRRDVLPGSA
jgi:plasmid maintenance system antidote protein VapI